MASSTLYEGWGRAAWGQGVWGTPLLIVEVDGARATSESGLSPLLRKPMLTLLA